MSTPNQQPTSKAEVIPSIVVKPFYAPNGQLTVEGKKYAYTPEKDKPYPWPLLRPQDEKLNDKLEQEYKSFRKEKLDKIADEKAKDKALRNLSGMGR